MDDVASDCITLARQLSANGSYSKSFDLYVLAFDKSPQMKSRFEQEFRLVLTKLNEVLSIAGRIEDIFYNFGRAIDAFPGNIYLINDIGKYLYKFGYYTEAWCHFQTALKLDSGFVNAEKNLNSVKNLMVERWHFRMLNDKIRNEAYRAAIKETVVPYKDSVLDLGTGTGLLAMYANECSPTATTGCDGSEVMTKLAEAILEENNIQVVVIVNKMSTSMNYRDIGGKRSLLVTEMFDAALFGEHVLQSLSHAREHLITNTAKVIPNKAEFFVAGVKCDHLHLRYHLSETSKKLLNIQTMHVRVVTYNDTYDCEDIHLFKDLKYITEPKSLVKVDFNNYKDVLDKLSCTVPINLNLKAIEDGEFNLVIGWFNLYLTDKITITTDPRSENRANAWQHAVFFDNIPEPVKMDQEVEVGFLMNRGKLTIVPNFNGLLMRVSPETLRFLNDTEFISMITKSIGMACVYLGQMAEISQINIVDLCPFPYFGLLMLKRGAQSVTCCAKTENDRKFFRKVFKANNIPLSKVTILVGDDWSQDIFYDEKYHAIFSNILEVCGDIDLRMKEISQHLRNAHLIQGGLFMPASVTMIGQLVNSEWLDINNRVYDENVSNYKMAAHMNKYQVSQNFCIDFTRLEYTPLTEPAEVGLCSSGMRSEVVNVPIIQDGYANAILCWYKIEVLEALGEISTNRSNSYIDGMVFLANPQVPMICGELANVLRCVDADGSFKLMIDVEAT